MKRFNKKGVSIIIAYVLLVVMGISMAVVVSNWIKHYAESSEELQVCPEQVSLVIKDYLYNEYNNLLEITIQNKGYFDVDGFVVRVHDRAGAESGFYILNQTNITLEPKQEIIQSYNLSNEKYINLGLENDLTIVDVQSFIFEDEEIVLCKDISSVKPVKQNLAPICEIYQENANFSEISGAWIGGGDILYDGNWENSDSADGDPGYFYINYIIPEGAVGAIWRVKDESGEENISIDLFNRAGCWEYTPGKLVLKVISSESLGDKVIWYCDEGSWNILRESEDYEMEVFEEAIIWNMC